MSSPWLLPAVVSNRSCFGLAEGGCAASWNDTKSLWTRAVKLAWRLPQAVCKWDPVAPCMPLGRFSPVGDVRSRDGIKRVLQPTVQVSTKTCSPVTPSRWLGCRRSLALKLLAPAKGGGCWATVLAAFWTQQEVWLLRLLESSWNALQRQLLPFPDMGCCHILYRDMSAPPEMPGRSCVWSH